MGIRLRSHQEHNRQPWKRREKDPNVTTKDLQTHVSTTRKYSMRMVCMEGYHKGSCCCLKTHCNLSQVCLRCSAMLLGKCSTARQHQNLIPNVKHAGGNIMVWGCLADSGPDALQLLQKHEIMTSRWRDDGQSTLNPLRHNEGTRTSWMLLP